jgi:hypothetical protein
MMTEVPLGAKPYWILEVSEGDYDDMSGNPHLVGIATDTGYTEKSEVERLQFVASLLIPACQTGRLEERNNERTETAVDMQANIVLFSESRKARY